MSDINTLFQCSRAAHRSGNLAAAAKGYAAILSVTQDLPEVWHLSGLLAHQMGQSERGINYIQHSLTLSPNTERRVDLTMILLSIGAHDAAEEQAEMVVVADPASSAGQYFLGLALVRQGKITKALPHLNRALNAKYQLERTLLELGLAYQALGQFEKSIRAFSALVKHNPQEVAGYFHLSRFVLTGQFGFSSKQVAVMRSMLRSSDTSHECIAWLHFSLGAHLEGKEKHAGAFEHYREANATERRMLHGTNNTKPFTGLSRTVERMTKFFDEDRVAALKVPNNVSRRPVFVVGLPRSGTTLCAQLLSNHPEIANLGELLVLGEVLQPLRPDWDTGQPTAETNHELIRDAASKYLAYVSSMSPDASFAVDKLPDNAMYIGFIHACFPEATIIYCRRDPRDVAISNFSVAFNSQRLKWETSTLEAIAETIREKTRLFRHWQKMFPGRLTEVHYESLVTAPSTEMQRLFKRIGVHEVDLCEQPKDEQTIVQSASSIQVRSPVYRSSVGRWERFSPHLGPILDMLQSEISDYEDDLASIMADGSHAELTQTR